MLTDKLVNAKKEKSYYPRIGCLWFGHRRLNAVKTGKSFKYLGRYFNFQMSDEEHKFELTSLIEELMPNIDAKPLRPKSKLILYRRYVLSKVSWHFTVSNISQTWVKENIDSIVNNYIRRWLEIPISGTLSAAFMPSHKFGLNICPTSIKFIQCQTIMRNALKSSPNTEINEFWKSTSGNKNVPYDAYTSKNAGNDTYADELEAKFQKWERFEQVRLTFFKDALQRYQNVLDVSECERYAMNFSFLCVFLF